MPSPKQFSWRHYPTPKASQLSLGIHWTYRGYSTISPQSLITTGADVGPFCDPTFSIVSTTSNPSAKGKRVQNEKCKWSPPIPRDNPNEEFNIVARCVRRQKPTYYFAKDNVFTIWVGNITQRSKTKGLNEITATNSSIGNSWNGGPTCNQVRKRLQAKYIPNQGVSSVQIKNWLPLVFGPVFRAVKNTRNKNDQF